jgi:hypothetical protein
MFSIECDRCGQPDVVSAPDAQTVVFASQEARLCRRCHDELRDFLSGAPVAEPVDDLAAPAAG